MQALIVREFGMEGQAEQSPLANGHGLSLVPRHHGHAVADERDPRGPDEDRRERRLAGQAIVEFDVGG